MHQTGARKLTKLVRTRLHDSGDKLIPRENIHGMPTIV